MTYDNTLRHLEELQHRLKKAVRDGDRIGQENIGEEIEKIKQLGKLARIQKSESAQCRQAVIWKIHH